MDLSHLIVRKTTDGHQVRHMLHGYKQPAAEHNFSMPKDRVTLPGGHVLTHIAQHLGIPHEVEERAEEKIAPGIHERVMDLMAQQPK